MKDEKRQIDDLLDINIAKEVEKRETARMEADFRKLVEEGIKEAKPAEEVQAQKPAEEVQTQKPAEKAPVPEPAEEVPVRREITIDEGETPARRNTGALDPRTVKRPDPHDPAVDTVIFDPEADEARKQPTAAELRKGRRAKRRQRKALLTDNARLIVKDVVIACIIALVISAFIRPTIVQETSMEPTVEPKDYLLMSRQAYRFGELERGDIVIFKSDLKLDEEHNKLLIKRVIALPGDSVAVQDGLVYLNGEPLQEPYIAMGGTPGYVEEITLGDNEVFVMGDHREVSVDSRSFGPIEKDTIVGQAVFRLWPLSGFGTLD